MSIAPNPSVGSVSMSLGGSEPYDGLEILDAAGRRIRRWSGPLTGTVTWDGLTRDGRRAIAGVYWVRGVRDGRWVTRRMVRIAR